ncbi:hypothetical protein NC796_18295 [Aliifodinibius sp. S!AR15-10]|uniref:hypothetical protein n=1 Tax=Aliifodinibius sp. S!AR15-10 TaxID=2950437 RepID=UPI00285467EC|nr:hypothetical protein [Aliifodinibius sp. S!AR15-10]MDR8393113.1 hypothetical protein [Aliifodinibius sp. S!AR15-10]
MDIFKLFFEHDLRLDKLQERHTSRNPETGPSIEDFMKPDPTYSKFYLTGTRLEEEKFGLNILEHNNELLLCLENIFHDKKFITAYGATASLGEALEQIDVGEAILISEEDDIEFNPPDLHVDRNSNVGHFKEELSEALKEGLLVLYKEKAHHGFDLHLFSMENIYEELFYPLKELVCDSFRFFSINNKRVSSERQFYFETWTLENPPHGAEEVFAETVL